MISRYAEKIKNRSLFSFYVSFEILRNFCGARGQSQRAPSFYHVQLTQFYNSFSHYSFQLLKKSKIGTPEHYLTGTYIT